MCACVCVWNERIQTQEHLYKTNILFFFTWQLNDSFGKDFYVAGRRLAALFQDVSNKTLKEETCFNML